VPFVSRCVSNKKFYERKYGDDLGMTAMYVQIDSSYAKLLATRFLSQHHSGIIPKGAVLQGNVWIVTLSVGGTNLQIKQVRIDAYSGMILGVS
jgi:hypothetical protein